MAGMFSQQSFEAEIAEEMERLEDISASENPKEIQRERALELIAQAAESLNKAGQPKKAALIVAVLEKIAKHDKNYGHRYDPKCRCSDCVEHEEELAAKIKADSKKKDKNDANVEELVAYRPRPSLSDEEKEEAKRAREEDLASAIEASLIEEARNRRQLEKDRQRHDNFLGGKSKKYHSHPDTISYPDPEMDQRIGDRLLMQDYPELYAEEMERRKRRDALMALRDVPRENAYQADEDKYNRELDKFVSEKSKDEQRARAEKPKQNVVTRKEKRGPAAEPASIGDLMGVSHRKYKKQKAEQEALQAAESTISPEELDWFNKDFKPTRNMSDEGNADDLAMATGRMIPLNETTYLRVKRLPHTDEWMVAWMENGRRDEGKTYYTDDLEDAIETMKMMASHFPAYNRGLDESAADDINADKFRVKLDKNTRLYVFEDADGSCEVVCLEGSGGKDGLRRNEDKSGIFPNEEEAMSYVKHMMDLYGKLDELGVSDEEVEPMLAEKAKEDKIDDPRWDNDLQDMIDNYNEWS